MNRRQLAIFAAFCATIALISIFAFDRTLATLVHESGFENAAFFVDGRSILDVFTGRGLVGAHVALGQFALGGLFIVVGLIGLAIPRVRYAARAFIFTGVVQWLTISIGWQIKEIFGRLRPFQVFERDDWSHIWFMGSNSFPSGHNAFFWGLFVPLIYAFPRARIPLLIIPVFIALARIDENYHFLSDVLASVALASILTLIVGWILRKWLTRHSDAASAPLSRQ
jgi:membrane-associated phospholipid phosphatase